MSYKINLKLQDKKIIYQVKHNFEFKKIPSENKVNKNQIVLFLRLSQIIHHINKIIPLII